MKRFSRRATVAVSLVAAGGAAIVLYRFPPGEYSFYPQCPVHALFGIDCPGCGATRALAALLHGRLSEALHDNPLIVSLLPLGLAYGLYGAWRSARHLPLPKLPVPSIYALAAVTAIFTVARNL